jgi:hypothetical protein
VTRTRASLGLTSTVAVHTGSTVLAGAALELPLWRLLGALTVGWAALLGCLALIELEARR